MSFGGSYAKSKLDTKEFPGAFGTPDSARVANMLQSLLSGSPAGQDRASSAYEQPLQESILQPKFGADTASEKALLGSIMDATAGRGSVRGLGAPTQTALAQSIAPALINLRQQDIGNLQSALSGDIGSQISQRGQDIGQILGVRGQDIGGLSELIGLSMPQIVAGQKSKQFGAQAGLCCFIFIEAHGSLLDIVRRYRDEHMTEKNRRGYYKVADKIVPIMKRSKAFKLLIRLVMTAPMVSYGKYYYGKGKIGLAFKPVAKLWLGMFDWIGGDTPYIRKNGEVI